MLKFFRNIFGLCDHTYEVYEKLGKHKNGRSTPFEVVYVNRCTKCGKIKITTVE